MEFDEDNCHIYLSQGSDLVSARLITERGIQKYMILPSQQEKFLEIVESIKDAIPANLIENPYTPTATEREIVFCNIPVTMHEQEKARFLNNLERLGFLVQRNESFEFIGQKQTVYNLALDNLRII